MSGVKAWEIAASAVKFPVVAVVGGVEDPPRLSQWGGDPALPPTSVTLEYGLGGLQVTTYPAPLWGDKEFWKDLLGFVERGYGSRWEARNGPPPDFEGLEIVETRRTPTENGYIELNVYEGVPVEEDEISRREQAASEAEHRMIELALGDLLVQAQVVGGNDLWEAGFETLVDGAPLVGLLGGTDIPPEFLKLELVEDLLTFLGGQ